MAGVSNNVLAGLLVVAIVVSIFGIAQISMIAPPVMVTYTGAATGVANVTVESSVAIDMIKNETNFGVGYPNSVSTGTILNIATNQSGGNPWGDAAPGGAASGYFNNGTEGNETNCTYGQGGNDTGPCAEPFVVRNSGNDPNTCIRIKAEAGSTAAGFIGGVQVTPTFKFAGKNNETGACTGTLTTAWTELTTSMQDVCTALNQTDSSDEIRIHFQLGIPPDSPPGEKIATLTLCADASCLCTG
jgi:hypothetical protein